MSGWGGAAGGASVAGWACRDEDADRVFKWVKGHSDMRRVRLVRDRGGLDMWIPRAAYGASVVHFHIYAVRPGHPALGS